MRMFEAKYNEIVDFYEGIENFSKTNSPEIENIFTMCLAFSINWSLAMAFSCQDQETNYGKFFLFLK